MHWSFSLHAHYLNHWLLYYLSTFVRWRHSVILPSFILFDLFFHPTKFENGRQICYSGPIMCGRQCSGPWFRWCIGALAYVHTFTTNGSGAVSLQWAIGKKKQIIFTIHFYCFIFKFPKPFTNFPYYLPNLPNLDASFVCSHF